MSVKLNLVPILDKDGNKTGESEYVEVDATTNEPTGNKWPQRSWREAITAMHRANGVKPMIKKRGMH